MIVTLLSYIGMIILLLALYLSRTDYKLSLGLNMLGGVFMSIWAVIVDAYAVLILNLIFGIIAIYNLWKLRGKKHVPS